MINEIGHRIFEYNYILKDSIILINISVDVLIVITKLSNLFNIFSLYFIKFNIYFWLCLIFNNDNEVYMIKLLKLPMLKPLRLQVQLPTRSNKQMADLAKTMIYRFEIRPTFFLMLMKKMITIGNRSWYWPFDTPSAHSRHSSPCSSSSSTKWSKLANSLSNRSSP